MKLLHALTISGLMFMWAPMFSQLAENPVFVEIIPHYGETYTVNAGGICGPVTYSLDGYVTYRIYVVLQDADDCLQAVFGSTLGAGVEDCISDSLDLFLDAPCGMFNHPLAGEFVIDNMCQFQSPGIEWDSFLTLGLQCSTTGTEMSFFPISCDADWIPELSGDGDCDLFDGQSFFIDGNAYFSVFGVQPDDENKVLVAQITTCGDICGQFGVQLLNGCTPGQPLTYNAPDLHFCQVNPCLAYPMTNFSSTPAGCESNELVTFYEGGMGYVNYQLYSSVDDTWLAEYSQVDGDLVMDNLSPGSYYLAMTDSVGCRDTSAVFSVTGPPEDYSPLTAGVSLFSGISCASYEDGSFMIECSGGLGEVMVSMTVNDTTEVDLQCDTTLYNLSCGSYAIHWVDELGCTVDTTLVLQCPDSLLVYASWTDVTCAGYADGTITFSYEGGTGDLTLTFLDPGEPQTIGNLSSPGELVFDNLEEGEYLFTFTDANGCSFSDTVIIVAPDQISGIITSGNELLGGDGWACVEATGGNGGYSYNWSSGATEDCAESLTPDLYTVEVSDIMQCSWSGETEVFASIGDIHPFSGSMLIWPNPSDELIYFSAQGLGQSPVNIRITDMTGRVLREEFRKSISSISVDFLAPGQYILSVWDGTMRYSTGFSRVN